MIGAETEYTLKGGDVVWWEIDKTTGTQRWSVLEDGKAKMSGIVIEGKMIVNSM